MPRGTPDLPPAGHERDELLKVREDALQEQAEIRAAQGEREAIDPAKVRVESELAQYFDELDVAGRDPAFAYCWVPTHTYGRFVQQKLYKGWEMVQGEMPEARALKHTDTTRKLGDVVLMRIPKARKELLDKREEFKRFQQEEGVSAQLAELAEQHDTQIIQGGDLDPGHLRRMQAQSHARNRAGRAVDKWIRQGRMPGMVMPQT